MFETVGQWDDGSGRSFWFNPVLKFVRQFSLQFNRAHCNIDRFSTAAADTSLKMSLGLVSISAYITCSIGSQFEYLKSSNGDGFAILGSAYKGEGSIPHEVKKELTKPSKDKLEVRGRLTGALSSVRPALTDKTDE